MELPQAHEAHVDRGKITDYLLGTSHPDGRAKARFFVRFGFSDTEWRILADALRQVGTSNPVVDIVESAYGTRYTVDGPLPCPDGRAPLVRTVWIVEQGKLAPRLITAHRL